MTKLVGDYNFFMTVLKHGIFDSTNRRKFLQALQKEKEAAMSASAGDNSRPTKRARVNKNALRRAVLRARLAYRRGERLSRKMKEDNTMYGSMSYGDMELLNNFEIGVALENRKSADQAYGHGRDVENLSIRERAVLRAWSTDVFSNYFNG